MLNLRRLVCAEKSYSKATSSILITIFLFFFASTVQASQVKDINPSWEVEDQLVEDFIKAMIQTYLFYSSFPDATKQPNFVFLSHSGLLEDGRMKKGKISKFFPDITEKTINEIAGDTDQCLVFTLDIQGRKMVVGVNNSDKTSADQEIRCFMATLAYFVDKENHDELRGDNPSQTARNIIDELRRRLD